MTAWSSRSERDPAHAFGSANCDAIRRGFRVDFGAEIRRKSRAGKSPRVACISIHADTHFDTPDPPHTDRIARTFSRASATQNSTRIHGAKSGDILRSATTKFAHRGASENRAQTMRSYPLNPLEIRPCPDRDFARFASRSMSKIASPLYFP